MSSLKFSISCLFLFFLTACSLFEPYIDRQRNPGTRDIKHLYSGPSKPDRPVICYNSWLTSDEELQETANAECIAQNTGKRAEFVKKTYFDGKLFLPHHAHYKCVK